MFENLPEKIKKLYQEKMREEEAAKLKDSSTGGDEGKWKMKFSKDERQGDKKQAKNFSLYESDEEDQTRNFQSHPQAQAAVAAAAAAAANFSGIASTSGAFGSGDKKRSPAKEVAPVPIIPKAAVVLDKFGNFRLAEMPQSIQKPENSSARRSRSRSRRSRSRSDSR